MKKVFFCDTNVLLDDPNAIDCLYDSGENSVYIPYSVILELDRLKKNSNKSHLVSAVVNKIFTTPVNIHRRESFKYSGENCSDETILGDIQDYCCNNDKSNLIFITNDKILQLRTKIELEIETQEYRQSRPFLSDSEIYTGIIQDGEEKVRNCFYWKEGKLYWEKNSKLIDYENEIWKVKPRTQHQNMLMELLLDNEIPVISVQSAPGYGKTFVSLAAALQLVFQKERRDLNTEIINSENNEVKRRGRKKKNSVDHNNNVKLHGHKKIFVVRPTTIIGEELGFLPGDLNEKIDPYFRPIKDLLIKLHEIRPCNKLFIDGDPKKGFDRSVIEFLPITYLRGMNLENAIVIVDECQNLSRLECRTLLSRMGEGVRCFLTGDTNQVDNKHLNSCNNGLNWILRKFKNQKEYAHITLKGPKSRGPIADLVIKTNL